jgi:hypothetical protein
MQSSALFYVICFVALAVVNVQARSSYNNTLIANVKKARGKTESLDDVADDVNSKNAMNSGLVSPVPPLIDDLTNVACQKIVEGLYNIADLVDAAVKGTHDVSLSLNLTAISTL